MRHLPPDFMTIFTFSTTINNNSLLCFCPNSIFSTIFTFLTTIPCDIYFIFNSSFLYSAIPRIAGGRLCLTVKFYRSILRLLCIGMDMSMKLYRSISRFCIGMAMSNAVFFWVKFYFHYFFKNYFHLYWFIVAAFTFQFQDILDSLRHLPSNFMILLLVVFSPFQKQIISIQCFVFGQIPFSFSTNFTHLFWSSSIFIILLLFSQFLQLA